MAGASGAVRIVKNRAAFDEITLAVADGMFELAKSIVLEARVPDAEPLGQGLIEGGGVLAYAGTKRVGVASTSGTTSIRKPRGTPGLKPYAILVVGGFGFPSRFVEEGTVRTSAQPFVAPELMAKVGDSEQYVKTSCARRGVGRKP
jgi:hypothetical protein